MKRFFLSLAALLVLAHAAHADATFRSTHPDRRVQDSSGRFQYIVTLDPSALESVPDFVNPQDERRFIGTHSGRARNLILALERRYGFDHFGMTSHIGLTFTAYLTPGQVQALSRNPRVSMIEEVTRVDFSATPAPPWSNIDVEVMPGTIERLSWGRVGTRGISLRTSTPPRIYVVDAGIGYHNDLQVVSRVNPNRLVPNQPATVSPVGCYSHATHVGGIIAGRGDNGMVAGMLADAPLYSVAVSTSDNTSMNPPCGQGSTSASIHAAFEWVMQNHPAGQRGVVNLSMNDGNGAFDPGATLHNDFLAMRDAGLVVVQSAGNQQSYAVWFAFHYRDPSGWAARVDDGILVVGGVNQNAQVVRRNPDGSNAYANAWSTQTEPGSNHGFGVDVWAPSLAIFSAWGVDPATSAAPQPDNPGSPSSHIIAGSGTSFAAPHVAGIAAAILSKRPGLTPQQVEGEIRAASYVWGQDDLSPEVSPLRMVVMPEWTVLDDMVERYYGDILNRGSDPGGKAFWVGEIGRLQGAGVDPRESFRTIAKQFFFGAEYAGMGLSDGAFVTDLYNTFYQRQPDSGGFNYWMGQFAAQQREGTHNNFMFAAEFESYMFRQLGNAAQRHDTGLVVDSYRAAFGRVPDSGGLASWREYIRSTRCSGGDVSAAARNMVWAFFHEAEYAGRNRNNRQYMTDLFEAILRRGPDSGGLDWWVGQLDTGGQTRDSALNSFFGSAEWTQQRVPQLHQDPC